MCEFDGIAEVKVLSLRDDDVVVLKVDNYLREDETEHIMHRAKRVFPDHRVVILEKGVDIEVLRPTEAVPS